MKRFIKFDFVVVGVSVLMYTAVAFLPFKAKSLGDLDFHLQAKQFAQVLWGNTDFNTLLINKAPGPVLFYTIPYFLAGPTASDQALWLSGVVWSFLLLTAALLMIRRAAANMGYDLAGKIAVIFLVLLPLHLYYSLGILAESLAFFGCSLFLFGWSIVVKEKSCNVYSLGWISFVLGLLCILLARPNSILIIPFLVLIAIVFIYIKKVEFYVSIKRAFFLAITYLTVSVMIVSLMVRSLPANKASSSQEGYLAYVILIGRFQFREETWDWRFWDGSNRPDSKDYQAYQSAKITLKEKAKKELKSSTEVYYDFARNDVLLHPFRSLKQFLVRAVFGHTLMVNSVNADNFGEGPFRGKAFFWLFHIGLNLVNGAFVLFSILVVTRSDFRRSYFIPLIVPWLALLFFHGFVYMEQRYIFPIRPVVVTLGSIFLAHYIQKLNLVKCNKL